MKEVSFKFDALYGPGVVCRTPLYFHTDAFVFTWPPRDAEDRFQDRVEAWQRAQFFQPPRSLYRRQRRDVARLFYDAVAWALDTVDDLKEDWRDYANFMRAGLQRHTLLMEAVVDREVFDLALNIDRRIIEEIYALVYAEVARDICVYPKAINRPYDHPPFHSAIRTDGMS